MTRMSVSKKRAEGIEEFRKLFAHADEEKLNILSGLIEEAYDCKEEIVELKESIRDLKERGAKFVVLSKRERLLTQKRASYVNMMSRLCKNLCVVNTGKDDSEGLEDYE